MPAEVSSTGPYQEVTGSLLLPLTRVKKTIAQDEDIGAVSAQSNFLITKATEMFIRYLADKSFTAGKAEIKVKKSLLYRDIANVVARTDNLEFLSDLVPQTTTWRNHKAKKAREGGLSARNDVLSIGQTTIDGIRPAPSAPKDVSILSEPSITSLTTNCARPDSSEGLVFQHYEPNGEGKAENNEDVEMI